ncbi:MAG TPA: sulfite exporter TauE/SafE family protein [Thiopseudomonas sp.]|nr:sulfite exporter TauE/SafE family protein [Thiopseudomonas sp.]
MDNLIYEALGIGLLLGTLLGLTGAGGSLVALPLLLSLHLPLRDAIGVSLGALALSALIGTVSRWRSGDVHLTPAVLLIVTGLPGSWIGQQLGQLINEFWLVLGFCLLVLWSAWRMWNNAKLPEQSDKRPLNRIMLVVIGLWVGILSGLMGVGGGFLIVPALLWFSPLSMLAAAATSMAVIAVVSGAGFIIYLSAASPPLSLLAGIAVGGSLGVLLGNKLATRLGGPILQRIFAIMLLSVSLSLAAQKLFTLPL